MAIHDELNVGLYYELHSFCQFEASSTRHAVRRLYIACTTEIPTSFIHHQKLLDVDFDR